MSRTTEFDIEQTVHKAMMVFWEKGYEATSINDLTEATGLLKGSLYNTFKSKEQIFLLCLEKYGVFSKSFFFDNKQDPKKYLKSFFKRLIHEGTNKEHTRGCLIMNSCIEFANSQSAPAKKNEALFSAIELNFESVARSLLGKSEKYQEKHKTNLVAAAFSIREISKFKKDRKFLTQIANNALKEFDIKL